MGPNQYSETIGADVAIKPNMVFSLECGARTDMINEVKIGGTVVVTDSGVKELNTLGNKMQRGSTS
jgi:Xaa-Pro aminopeptidase